VKTKKQTRQTNLIPAFNYFISWNRYFRLYKLLPVQSKSVFTKTSLCSVKHPKTGCRLPKLIQTYEQEIANLQQKLNSPEQYHKSTTNSN